MGLFRKEPAAADLKANLAALVASMALKRKRADEIQDELPGLLGDWKRHAERSVELDAIKASLATDGRTQRMIEDAIPSAEKREAIADYESRRFAQERATAKLMRSGRARYEAAASELASAFSAFADDEAAWARLNREANELGLDGRHGRGAEDQLRRGYFGGSLLFRGIDHGVHLWDWEGRKHLHPSAPTGMMGT